MSSPERLTFSKLKMPIILMGIFWAIALVLWLTTGKVFYIFNFGYIGTAIGVGISVYEALPRNKKYRGRRLSQLLVGIYMLGFLALLDRHGTGLLTIPA